MNNIPHQIISKNWRILNETSRNLISEISEETFIENLKNILYKYKNVYPKFKVDEFISNSIYFNLDVFSQDILDDISESNLDYISSTLFPYKIEQLYTYKDFNKINNKPITSFEGFTSYNYFATDYIKLVEIEVPKLNEFSLIFKMVFKSKNNFNDVNSFFVKIKTNKITKEDFSEDSEFEVSFYPISTSRNVFNYFLNSYIDESNPEYSDVIIQNLEQLLTFWYQEWYDYSDVNKLEIYLKIPPTIGKSYSIEIDIMESFYKDPYHSETDQEELIIQVLNNDYSFTKKQGKKGFGLDFYEMPSSEENLLFGANYYFNIFNFSNETLTLIYAIAVAGDNQDYNSILTDSKKIINSTPIFKNVLNSISNDIIKQHDFKKWYLNDTDIISIDVLNNKKNRPYKRGLTRRGF